MVKNEDTRTKLLRRATQNFVGGKGGGNGKRATHGGRGDKRWGGPSCKARQISPKQVKGATVSYMKGSLRSRLLSCGTAGCPPTHHPGRPQILAPRPSAWRVRRGFARRGAPVRSAGTNEGEGGTPTEAGRSLPTPQIGRTAPLQPEELSRPEVQSPPGALRSDRCWLRPAPSTLASPRSAVRS